MNKTLYVSDLDGTLLTRKSKMSKTSIEILNKFIENGGLFTYATARSFHSSSIVTEGLKLNLPAVIYSGVTLCDAKTGEPIYTNFFDKESIKSVKKVLSLYNVYPLSYAYINNEEKFSYLKGKETQGMLDYLNNRKGDIRIRPIDDIDDLYKHQVFYFTCIGHKEDLQTIYDIFKNEMGLTCVFQQELYKTEYWLEIMPKGSSKANGVLKIKEMFDIDKIITFGDGINDIPMFLQSNECYATKCACEELKKHATAVIGDNDDDAVARFIYDREKLGEKYGRN